MATLLSKPKMPEKSADQIAAEKFQADEIKRLKAEEDQRKSALTRSQGGRASLISGAETGVKDTLG
jgi:hypothetical protein